MLRDYSLALSIDRSQVQNHHRRSADIHDQRETLISTLRQLALQEDASTAVRRTWPFTVNEHSVMLIQPHAIESQVVAGMLSVLGYRVARAADVGNALFWFGKQPCELIISELDMPFLNGFQLARYFRRHSPQTRILLMTACCQAEVIDYMDGRVVDGWLFKPFDLGALNDMLEKLQHV